MDTALVTISIVVIVALIFDYINGFHDAANSIATVVSTRVLSLGQAVVGGVSQFHRGVLLWHGRRQDRWQGHGGPRCGHLRRNPGGLTGAIL